MSTSPRPARVRPGHHADERAQLTGWLDLQRAVIHWKCEDLDEDLAHRALLPTSPLMTVAGLVAHLRWTEHCWFEVVLMGRPSSVNPQFDEGAEDLDWSGAAGRTLPDLLEEYAAQCAVSDELVAAHSLDDRARHQGFYAPELSLRWILNHMVEETARHVGQLDLLREQIDGRTGYY